MIEQYQTNFTELYPHTANETRRIRKAKTTLAVLKDFLGEDLSELKVLNVGCSTAVIDKYLAEHVADIVAMDIDQQAIKCAKEKEVPANLHLLAGNAQELAFADNSFDIVMCSHVYEHVPNDDALMAEINRVMKPNAICYFAAGNRLCFREPHHKLPLLSVIPRPLAHLYMRLTGKGNYYYEKHRWYWGLNKLVGDFQKADYTMKIISNPMIYQVEYMISPGSIKHRVACIISKYCNWLLPSYVWILKPKVRVS